MCLYPRLAVRLGLKDNGKEAVKFLSRWRVDYSYAQMKDKYGDALLSIPCGHCPECTRAYSKQWSVRLMLECLYHDEASFVTLTFDNKHYPKDLASWKREGQLFLKRLRKHYPDKFIRFFGCGELGSTTKRKHFHFILFGVTFHADGISHVNELGQVTYESQELREIWKNGRVDFGEVTPDSCAYVARYSMKKLLSIEQDEPCFLMMSNHPGIGSLFYHDKKDIIYLSDKIYSSHFHGEKVPRFFDKLAERDPKVYEMFLRAKNKRITRGQQRETCRMFLSGSPSRESMLVRHMYEVASRLILPKRGF